MEKILFFLYDFLWTLFAAPLLPLALKRKNTRIAERLVFDPLPCRLQSKPVWVHALSVGEVISALPLVEALKGRYPLRPIVFTAATSQGVDMARRKLQGKADCLFRMPLDFWWNMRRVIRFVRPALLIIVETDLWPGYLRLLKKKGVRILLVNSRISPRTFKVYGRFRFLVRRMLFAGIDRCLMQSDLDCRRLLEIGVPAGKVIMAGNIKFDREWTSLSLEEKEGMARSLGLDPAAVVWVSGSTHHGEEGILLDTFVRLRPLFPALRLIIAPRRIEESKEVHGMALARGLKAVLRTEAAGIMNGFDVLILNTLGELSRVYAVSRVSFVGGSLIPVGGHNLLEPASFGRPVLFGPYTHNFVSMSQLLLEARGGIQIRDGEELFLAMRELLSEPHKAVAMGKRAREFVERNRGALNRVMENVGDLLAGC